MLKIIVLTLFEIASVVKEPKVKFPPYFSNENNLFGLIVNQSA